MEYVLPSVVLSLGLVTAAVLLFLRRGPAAHDAGDKDALMLLQNQLNASSQQTAQQVDALTKTVVQSLQALSGQMSRSMTDTNKSVADRLDGAARVMGDVRQKLGQLEESSRRMTEVGRDIAQLQDILKPPKLRGSLGELFLGDLLSQILPPSHYALQYRFKGGEAVDAVVRLRMGLVPIDAKFPLDNLKRVLAAENEDARKAAKKVFVRDVKTHIDALAKKYIRTDENTFDFALMYIPAENVYYETIIKDDDLGGEMSLFTYALGKRVIPVSPNSFYAYLQTIILGLKGMRVEEESREIITHLARLRKDFENFADAFRLVGQHLDNSVKKYAAAQNRFSRIEAKVDQIDGLAQDLSLEGQPAVPSPALPDGTDRASK